MSSHFERGFCYTTQSGRHMYKWPEAEFAASNGKLPEPPDFSADTHRPYGSLIDQAVQLARAGNLSGLIALRICPGRKELSSTPRAIQRWVNLCVRALRGRTGTTEAFVEIQRTQGVAASTSQTRDISSNDSKLTEEVSVIPTTSELATDALLSITEAKRRLAATLGVKPEAIEITIRA